MTELLRGGLEVTPNSEPPTKKPRFVTVADKEEAPSFAVSQSEKMDTSSNGTAANGNSKSGKPVDGGNVLDHNLYSRQIYALGESAMMRLREASVLIAGLGGVGVEIAKNLILGGVRHVAIQDTRTATWADLSAQYYLHKEDLGKNRAEASFERLAELNDSVTVTLKKEPLSEQLVSAYDLTILTDAPLSVQLEVSGWTRKAGRRLLVADARGLFAQVFVDLGAEFRVDDADGEQCLEVLIEHIDVDTGDVTTLEGVLHGFRDGDHVVFSEVKGLDVNNKAPIKISVKKPNVFNIGDAAKGLGVHEEGGRAKQTKVPFTLTFKPLAEALKEPEFLIWDFAKFDQPAQQHALWQALHAFEEKHKRRLRPRNAADVELLKAEIPAGTEVDAKLLTNFANSATGNLVTIASVVGGIAAQEAMKAVTHHMTPMRQFLYLDSVEALPGPWTAFDNEKLSEEDVKPRESRYDGQAAVFGWKYQEALARQRLFIVGAGAIGCELLKNLAMMGVACGDEGLLKITDMDTIEVSNLNRQFLFRRKDVGSKKAEVAAEAVKDFNPEVRIKCLAERVGPDTEEIFNDAFFGELNGVLNALDNVDARRYMDRRCVFYRLPLLESGTMGSKGNTQVVYPHLTESYGSSADPPEKDIPVCTLKNFPNAIEHTIQWARDKFEELFTVAAETTNEFLRDQRGFLARVETMHTGQRVEMLQQVVHELIDARPHSAEDCIKWARLHFQESYHDAIRQMLHSFPPDQVTDQGAKFWSGSKRCPHPLEFDPSQPEHFNYVWSASILRAQQYGLKPILDRNEFVRIAKAVEVTPFKPNVHLKIATTDAEAKEHAERGQSVDGDGDAVVEQLKLKLARVNLKEVGRVEAIDFEKDDDTNHHMEFVTAASNLRAENYDIAPADWMRTKQIAGRIIPAIATTTAVVAGLVCVELYKIVDATGLPKTPLERFKNGFLNLALPFVGFSEPISAPKKKYLDKEFTLWSRLEVDGPKTLKEVIDYIQVSMLSSGVSLVYSFFMDAKKRAERMDTEMARVVADVSRKQIPAWQRSLVLEPMCTNPDTDEDLEVPYLLYKF